MCRPLFLDMRTVDCSTLVSWERILSRFTWVISYLCMKNSQTEMSPKTIAFLPCHMSSYLTCIANFFLSLLYFSNVQFFFLFSPFVVLVFLQKLCKCEVKKEHFVCLILLLPPITAAVINQQSKWCGSHSCWQVCSHILDICCHCLCHNLIRNFPRNLDGILRLWRF